MTTIYIGYYNLTLNLFSSETSEVPCSDQFSVSYNTTEHFEFCVKQGVSGVTFCISNPVKWYDQHDVEIPCPSNITHFQVSDLVLTFQDQNITKAELKHRFALQMLVNGQPAAIGPGPVLTKAITTSTYKDPVDPTIIDVGDLGL